MKVKVTDKFLGRTYEYPLEVFLSNKLEFTYSIDTGKTESLTSKMNRIKDTLVNLLMLMFKSGQLTFDDLLKITGATSLTFCDEVELIKPAILKV